MKTKNQKKSEKVVELLGYRHEKFRKNNPDFAEIEDMVIFIFKNGSEKQKQFLKDYISLLKENKN